MTLELSNYAIGAMGFSRYPESDVLKIKFAVLRVFSLEGISLSPRSDSATLGVVDFGENCTATISNSLNEACLALTGDVFIDEEEASWIKQRKTKPPFLMIHFEEFSSRTLKGGMRKEHDGKLMTYRAFPDGKADIRKFERETLPTVITAIVSMLSDEARPINLTPLGRTIFGLTSDGIAVWDLDSGGTANITLSTGISDGELFDSLSDASKTFKKIMGKSSSHYYSAVNEDDKQKQLLGYFHFIERFTHMKFKEIDYWRDVSPIINAPDRVGDAANEFIEKNIFADSKNLNQRFHWCALTVWSHLNNKDIADFKLIKRTRDQLAHGEDIPENELPVEAAKNLASKLVRGS